MKTIIFLTLIFYGTNLNAQKLTKCEDLISLLNNNEILHEFRSENNPDSLILIDPSNIIPAECNSFRWGKSYIKVLVDSSILKALDTVYAHGIFLNKCEYYLLTKGKGKGNNRSLNILHACSNVEVRVIYRIFNKKYKPLNITSVVY